MTSNFLLTHRTALPSCCFITLISGSMPRACHSHAAAIVGQRMFISGGTQDYQHTFSGLHAMDLVTGTWQAVKPQGDGPSSPSCFSHTMTALGALLVVAGGCHTLGAGLPHSYMFYGQADETLSMLLFTSKFGPCLRIGKVVKVICCSTHTTYVVTKGQLPLRHLLMVHMCAASYVCLLCIKKL